MITEFKPYSLKRRMRNLAKATSNKQMLVRFVRRCARDRAFFVNNCCDTFNPQLKVNKDQPFFLALRQVECLEHIHYCVVNDLDTVYLKSRKVGGSWLHVAYDLWAWLFVPGYECLYGSRIDALVDSKGAGNMDSLMAKFDYMYRRLPLFLKIKEYGAKPPFKVDFMRKNPLNESTIKGEAVTTDFGAAGRAARALIDELSRAKWGQQGWESCGQTAPSRHAIFTPQGKDFAWGLAFPDEYSALTGEKNPERPKVFRIYWKDIPWFNEFHIFPYEVRRGLQFNTQAEFERWFSEHKKEAIYVGSGYGPEDEIPLGMGYDDGKRITRLRERKPLNAMPARGVSVLYAWHVRQSFRYKPHVLAQEVDIEFEASKTGRVYAAQMAAVGRKTCERNPKWPLYICCDPGRGAGNAFYIAWIQFNPTTNRYEAIREITAEGKSVWWFRAFVAVQNKEKYISRARKDGLTEDEEEFAREVSGKKWVVDDGFGDPNAIIVKGANAPDSVKGIFNKAGVPLRGSYKHVGFEARIDNTQRVLPHLDIDPAKCPRLLTGLSQISWRDPTEKTTRTTPENGYIHHPIHSHPVAAFEQFACNDPMRLFLEDEENEGTDTEDRFGFMDERPEYALDDDPNVMSRGKAGY